MTVIPTWLFVIMCIGLCLPVVGCIVLFVALNTAAKLVHAFIMGISKR